MQAAYYDSKAAWTVKAAPVVKNLLSFPNFLVSSSIFKLLMQVAYYDFKAASAVKAAPVVKVAPGEEVKRQIF
jgi:hypothetical protein